jgi:hypothetical protein
MSSRPACSANLLVRRLCRPPVAVQGPPQAVADALQPLRACASAAVGPAQLRGVVAVQLLPAVAVPASIADLCSSDSEYRRRVEDAVIEDVCSLHSAGNGTRDQAVTEMYPNAVAWFTVVPPADEPAKPGHGWKIWVTVAGVGVASLAFLAVLMPLVMRAVRRASGARAHRARDGNMEKSSSGSEEASRRSSEAGVVIGSTGSSRSGGDVSGTSSEGWRLSDSSESGSRSSSNVTDS